MTWAPQIKPFGDNAVIVHLGLSIDLPTHEKVRALSFFLDQHRFPGMIEYIPAFTTVTVFYDPLLLSLQEICSKLEDIIMTLEDTDKTQPTIVEIPVCYGGEFGPDLQLVAVQNRLTMEEVIRIHAKPEYLVYMVGFAPGFPYLGGISESIATPRRESPRLAIPAGSVGIAGMQTGVYPIETPGGWQVIGRTPLALFRPDKNPPSLLKAGDLVRFRPITRGEYEDHKEGRS